MNFKRARILTPKSKAHELFKEDIIDGSLTEDGSFELIPGSEVELQTLHELMRVSSETPHLTVVGCHIEYKASGEEDATRVTERGKRLSNIVDQLTTPKSVSTYVSNTDSHVKWTRVVNELTRIIKTQEPIVCIRISEGPVLEANICSLWKDEVEMLMENPDIAICNIFIKEAKLILQFKLL